MELKAYTGLVWADVMRTINKDWAYIQQHNDYKEATQKIENDFARYKAKFESGELTEKLFAEGCVLATADCLCQMFDDFRHKNIVLNVPHTSPYGFLQNGWGEDIRESVNRWTDWFTKELFDGGKNPYVKGAIFPFSRFVCDVERLENDPLEAKGQGILYTEFDGIKRGKFDRDKLMGLYYNHIDTLKKLLNVDSILIDCHSFPSDLSNVDICVGFNDDWSKPSRRTLAIIKEAFKGNGYRVGFNKPYSNSISPKMPFDYQSVMIEVNKRCYLNADNTINQNAFAALHERIIEIYNDLLKEK